MLNKIEVTEEMRANPNILPDIPRYLYQVYVNETNPNGSAIYKRLIREVIFHDSPDNSPDVEYKLDSVIPTSEMDGTQYVSSSLLNKTMSWIAKHEIRSYTKVGYKWEESATYQYLTIDEKEAFRNYELFLSHFHHTWEEEANRAAIMTEEFQIRLAEFAKYKDIIIF